MLKWSEVGGLLIKIDIKDTAPMSISQFLKSIHKFPLVHYDIKDIFAENVLVDGENCYINQNHPKNQV